MHRDVISAYALTTARVIAWILVSATVYPPLSARLFRAPCRSFAGPSDYSLTLRSGWALRWCMRWRMRDSLIETVRLNPAGLPLSLIAAVLTLGLTLGYRLSFSWLHRVPPGAMTEQFAGLILFFGIGDALRVLSEPQGAILQTSDRIALDNLILIGGEIAWACLSMFHLPHTNHPSVVPIAVSFAITSLLVWLVRLLIATDWRRGEWFFESSRTAVILGLLSFGIFVLVSQLSDFLYAPTDMILINRLLAPADLAAYAPAIQIDAGLLMLMTGLAAVLLPKAALAHAAGDRAAVATLLPARTHSSAADFWRSWRSVPT